LVRRSPHALYHSRLRLQGLHAPSPRATICIVLGILSWASAPLQRMPKHRAAAHDLRFPVDQHARISAERHPAAPPLRFRPLQRFPRSEQRHELAGHASPNRLRLQVLTTSWRLHPPRACRPYFMPDPLLGSPFRSFFLPRSRTLFPAPLPSWRSHRLQGFAPRESPPPGPAV